MRFLTCILLLIAFLSSKSQISNALSIGHVETIYSRTLKEERKIWIYNPGSGNNKDRYPVLYLLDAEDHFFSTVGMVKQMSGRWPDIIIVGITNTNRSKDLTPTSTNNASSGDRNTFMHFVASELIPHIDSLYPTAPYRLFSGHSLGGLTVIHTLLNHPNLFNAYIAIDPSLWWNNQQFIAQAQKDFSTKKFKNVSLFVARANNMPPGMDTLTALKDTTPYTTLYRSVTQFVNMLSKSGNAELRWATKFYPEESHGTVQLNAQYDALKFLFSDYQFRTSIFERNPTMNIDSALIAHFKTVSERLGYRVLPSQSLVNNLGYTCMGLKKWEKAKAFFQLNIENYPQDANCYDSMGDFCAGIGHIDEAIMNYAKALTLGNDAGTRQKWEALKSKTNK